MSDEPEEWRAAIGWEGLYEVSSLGRVKSLPRQKLGRFSKIGVQSIVVTKTRILKLYKMRDSYLLATLCANGEVHKFLVHRLVAEAFHGKPPSSNHEVAHFDGVRWNNRAANLRWATRSQNYADRHRHGTQNDGEKNGFSKLTEADIKQIRLSRERGVDIATRYGVDKTCISQIRLRKSWRHVE